MYLRLIEGPAMNLLGAIVPYWSERGFREGVLNWAAKRGASLSDSDAPDCAVNFPFRFCKVSTVSGISTKICLRYWRLST